MSMDEPLIDNIKCTQPSIHKRIHKYMKDKVENILNKYVGNVLDKHLNNIQKQTNNIKKIIDTHMICIINDQIDEMRKNNYTKNKKIIIMISETTRIPKQYYIKIDDDIIYNRNIKNSDFKSFVIANLPNAKFIQNTPCDKTLNTFIEEKMRDGTIYEFIIKFMEYTTILTQCDGVTHTPSTHTPSTHTPSTHTPSTHTPSIIFINVICEKEPNHDAYCKTYFLNGFNHENNKYELLIKVGMVTQI